MRGSAPLQGVGKMSLEVVVFEGLQFVDGAYLGYTPLELNHVYNLLWRGRPRQCLLKDFWVRLGNITVVLVKLRGRRFCLVEIDAFKGECDEVNLNQDILFFQSFGNPQKDVIFFQLVHGLRVDCVVLPFMTDNKFGRGPVVMRFAPREPAKTLDNAIDLEGGNRGPQRAGEGEG